MLKIVIDGAGDIPKEWLSEYDIHVIPINIHFDNKMYLQGVDLSNDDFYRIADTIAYNSQDITTHASAIRRILQTNCASWRYDPVTACDQ